MKASHTRDSARQPCQCTAADSPPKLLQHLCPPPRSHPQALQSTPDAHGHPLNQRGLDLRMSRDLHPQ
ncbi:hypothetical protein BDW59DRAFT_100287 [Aspergillus cavernicola]|uniref:Uncharacterized protein n=1 Tax=Aspergillus cavernicola TaxID=176166 RepID=A0ABR4I656_9EURO